MMRCWTMWQRVHVNKMQSTTWTQIRTQDQPAYANPTGNTHTCTRKLTNLALSTFSANSLMQMFFFENKMNLLFAGFDSSKWHNENQLNRAWYTHAPNRNRVYCTNKHHATNCCCPTTIAKWGHAATARGTIIKSMIINFAVHPI